MRNSKGVSLIALIITIIVIIILAAIVMNASTSTVGNAQFAKFSQEFGEFSDQVALDAANVKSNTGIKGQVINDAQMFFMTANGYSRVNVSGEGVFERTQPVGYVVTNYNTADQTHKYVLQHILNIGDDKSGEVTYGRERTSGDREVAYVINDGVITNYKTYGDNNSDGSASHEFYGDSNGKEYHFVTSNGMVFTLPGYPVTQEDGSIQYHIDSKNGHYYVVKGNSGITPAAGAVNINGDEVTNEMPIFASYLRESKGVNANSSARIGNASPSATSTDTNTPMGSKQSNFTKITF